MLTIGLAGLTIGLAGLNIYYARESYIEGTKPNTLYPIGGGLHGGSEAEGILNAIGTLAWGIPLGTTLRQSVEFGTTGAKPGKILDAVKSGSGSTAIGMGVLFGSFR